MKIIFIVLFNLILVCSFMAQTSIRLWNGDAPNALGKEPIDIPTITPFLALKEKSNGAAILVLPGGGYGHLSDIKEGSAVAEWLNSLGISAFVLKYRLGPKYGQPNQLLDSTRALRKIRSRAKHVNLE